ncbi:MAG: GGDEF domain-containing protein [Acidimicrobiales bacterium]
MTEPALGRDSLTGVLDRATLMAKVDHALRQPHGTAVVAVLFVDFDRFKDVNDQHGHRTGDRVLVAASHRIESVLRGSDHIGRLGGDEFAVLCASMASHDEAAHLATRIVASVAEPFTVDEQVLHIGASVGIAFAEGHDTAEALVHHADRAMYRAKAEGRGRWAVFSAERGEAERRHDLAAWATVAQAAVAVTRAERDLHELWSNAVGFGDEALSATLVAVGHALREAGRLLDRESVASSPRVSGLQLPHLQAIEPLAED